MGCPAATAGREYAENLAPFAEQTQLRYSLGLEATPRHSPALGKRPQKAQRKDFTNARAHTINAPMNIRPRSILLVAPVALASVSWLSDDAVALDFSQARVTQVVQDVKVMSSGAAARPAAVNETVHQGSAVQTGTQSRNELTFQDQSITRLGEKTIFSVGGGPRSIELGTGQFL